MTAVRTRIRFATFLGFLILCTVASVACGSGTSASPTGSGGGAQGDEVLETMNAGGYTYIRVRTDEGDVWAAGPQTTVAVGDRVNLTTGSLMKGFESKSLDRTFDAIYFVGAIEVVGGSKTTADSEAADHGRTTAAADPGADSILKAEAGSTIAELFARRNELDGEQVVVRGKVVKYTAGIMGRNWIHIQDGTGEAGTNDLTVTTQGTARVDDVILVQGTAAVDKDFGAGYRYTLILEKATITVE